MATYKNRKVAVIQELPHPQGAQVLIEHLELLGQREIVPKTSVVMTKDEKAAWDKQAEQKAKDLKGQANDNDFRVEGVNEEGTAPFPTYKDVIVQRQAEDNLARAEEQAKDNEDWQKKHPKAPAGAKQQLDAIKVVPYKDETPKSGTPTSDSDKNWYARAKK